MLNQDTNAAVHAEITENSSKICQHDNRLDEEIGIYCIKCGVVSVDIKCVKTEFVS